MAHVMRFDQISMSDLPAVGGKNASLGEMITRLSSAGITVPGGFATTADSYWRPSEPERARRSASPTDSPASIPRMSSPSPPPAPRSAPGSKRLPSPTICNGRSPPPTPCCPPTPGPRTGCRWRCARRQPPRTCPTPPSPGSRRHTSTSSASTRCWLPSGTCSHPSTTTEPSPTGSTGATTHEDVAPSAGVQRMVRSDVGVSGVAFSIDTESGFPGVVFLTATYGLGELLVQGAVNPDEFTVSKTALAAGRPAVLGRHLGHKNRHDGVRHRRHPGSPPSTCRWRWRGRSASPMTRCSGWRRWWCSSRTTTAGRWTSSGPRTGSPASSWCCRRARRRSSPQSDARVLERFHLEDHATGPHHRTRRRCPDRDRGSCVWCGHRLRCHGSRRATSSSPT